MRTSDDIQDLAAALTAVQAAVGNLPKTATGHNYRYTPLEDVTAALRGPLSKNDLSYVQLPATPPVEYYPAVALTTRLMHKSGQWLEETMIMPVPSLRSGNEAQGYGAALTYARRYALTAMFGIAADDDTDAATVNDQPNRQPARVPKAPNGSTVAAPKPPQAMVRKFHALGEKKYGDEWDDKRAELTEAITKRRQGGSASRNSADLYRAEMQLLIDGMAE